MQGKAICHLLFTILRNVFNLILVMRTTAIIFFAGLLQVSAHGYAQEKITLSEKNAPLLKVLDDIQKQTVYNIWYDKTVMPQTATVSIELKDASIEQTLDLCLSGLPLKYSMVGKNVVIEEKDKKKNTDPPDKIDVKGKVVNEKGEPLSGTNVSVKHSSLSAATDAEGEFTLHQLEANATLVVSHVGYESQEILLKANKELTIRLTLSVSYLDQVQIIAYGSVSKRLNTGDFTTITSETISEQPISNPLAALEGRVSGLSVIQNSGIPGAAFSVQIRGQNSIQNGNSPLYIIDGVPYPSAAIGSPAVNILITGGGNPLSSINPDEIESINILKDADATAIYGSRGANGVILITTKQGKIDKTRFDLNLNSGAGSVTRTMKLLTTQQYLQMRHEAFFNDNANSRPNDYDLVSWDTTRYTDWGKTLIGGTASQTDLHATLSGGNQQTQFVIGGNYRIETTVFGHDFKDQKGSAYINLHHHSTNNKFNLKLSTNYNAESNLLPNYDLTSQVFRLPPDAPAVFDSLGNLNWEKGTFNNPFGIFKRSYLAKTENFISSLLLDYQIMVGLHLKTNLGYSKMEVNEISSDPTTSINPVYGFTSGLSYFSNQTLHTWIIEPQLEYISNGKAGAIKILAGSTFQNNLTQGQILLANGFTSDLLLQDIGAASSITQQGTTYALYRYSAAFGRINYNWKDEYILNLTARRDGSSRFGQGKQFANFGALGTAWIFSKESGVQKLFPFLSFGKIRASYGITGNDQIGDYQYISTWTSSYYPYANTSGIFPVNLSDPVYGWEVNRKMEAGVDLSFWKDHLSFSASYYINRSSNQLVNTPLPSITGFTSIQSNLPAIVRNNGWEFEASSVNFKSKNFTWGSSINLTIPHNRLIAFPGITGSAYQNLYSIGQPLSLYKSFHYRDVDPKTGIYVFEDVDNDGSISYPNDILPIKSVSQDYFGGVENDIRFKSFQLNIFFQFVKQTGRNYSYYYPGVPGSATNQPELILSRWQKPGDLSNVQQFTQSYSSAAYVGFSNYRMSDNTISDASFLRLKTLNISYQVPLKQRSDAAIQSVRIYVQGQNLLTITRYLGIDPENQTTNALPPLKMLVAGLQIIL
jgi:TonB-dependent starch-binding outer membrane protein SusC